MRVPRSLTPVPALLAALIMAACTEDVGTLAPVGEIGGPVPQFSITVLDLVRLGTSTAAGINDPGQIVGLFDVASRQAYRWENGSIIHLGTLGGDRSEARRINARGDVVGNSTDASGNQHAFLWRDGTMRDLGTLGGRTSGARDINGRGQIVGHAETASLLDHAVLWENGVPTDLGTMGGLEAVADGINAHGQIVGTALQQDLNSVRAFLWENGAQRDLGPPLSSGNSQATDINDLRQIVGTYSNPSGDSRAYLWENGVLRDLGDLGGSPSIPFAINDLGQVVGSSRTGAGDTRAFLWENGVMYDLGAVGTSNTIATGINNLGEVVGRTAGLGGEAIRWTVPIAAAFQVSPSPIPLSTGPPMIEVTVLSSPYFDATRINPATVTLGNDDGLETPVAQKVKGDPRAMFRDVDRDGDTDLVLVFDKQALISNGDLSASTTKLTLLGRRLDSRHIRGKVDVTVQ